MIQVWLGAARLGPAWQGRVWQGRAGLGTAWVPTAHRNREPNRHGTARPGSVGPGQAGLGMGAYGTPGQGVESARRGWVRRGEAGPGKVGFGGAGPGWAWVPTGQKGALVFPSKRAIRKAVDQLWVLLEPMNRGDLLSHGEMTKILGVPPHEHPWGLVVFKLRRRMEEERGISLVADMMVGYRLATTEEQLQLGPTRTRRAMRQLRRGQKSVDCLPDDDLTFHQRRIKVALGNRLAQAESAMRRDLQLQSFLMRPREKMPRIAVEELGQAAEDQQQAG